MGILRGSVVHRYALWCTGCNGRHGKSLNKKAEKLPFCTFNPMVEGSNPSRPTIKSIARGSRCCFSTDSSGTCPETSASAATSRHERSYRLSASSGGGSDDTDRSCGRGVQKIFHFPLRSLCVGWDHRMPYPATLRRYAVTATPTLRPRQASIHQDRTPVFNTTLMNR